MAIKPNPLAPKIAVPLKPVGDIETRSPSEVKREIAARLRAITAADFRGLTPEDVDRAMRQQSSIDAITEQYADQVSRSGIAISAAQRRALERLEDRSDKRNELIFKSKEGAAKSVAESNLTAEEQAKWLERITKTERFEDALALAIEANALPKRQTSGVERDAVSSELFNGRNYSQLTPTDQAKVNSELSERDRFVVVNRQGVWAVDKRTGRAKLITRDPTSAVPRAAEGRTYNEPNTESGVSSTPITPPRSEVTTPSTSTGTVEETDMSPLVRSLRGLPREKALAAYERTLKSNIPLAGKQIFRDSLIQAHPALEKSLPPLTGRQSNIEEAPTPTFVSGPAQPTTFTAGNAPSRPPEFERVQTGLRGLGPEGALNLTLEVLTSNATYAQKELYRTALIEAYPELGEPIPSNVPAGELPALEAPREPSLFDFFATNTAQAQEPLEGRTRTESSQRPTEAQQKAFAYGSAALKAQNIITLLEAGGTTRDPWYVAMLQGLADLSPIEKGALVGGATVGGGGVGGATTPPRASVPLFSPPGTSEYDSGRVAMRRGVGAGIGAVLGIGGLLLTKPTANALRSEVAQSYRAAKQAFVDAVKRDESGAAVGAMEKEDIEAKFFPVSGDDDSIVRQKAEMRELYIRSAEIRAGRKLITK